MPATVKGDLSSWIFQLHGITKDESSHEFTMQASTGEVVPSLITSIAEIVGPEPDSIKRRGVIAKLNEVTDHRTAKELAAAYSEDKQKFDSQLRQRTRELIDELKMTDGLPAVSELASYGSEQSNAFTFISCS